MASISSFDIMEVNVPKVLHEPGKSPLAVEFLERCENRFAFRLRFRELHGCAKRLLWNIYGRFHSVSFTTDWNPLRGRKEYGHAAAAMPFFTTLNYRAAVAEVGTAKLSISRLISWTKLAAPAPFTTR